MALDTLTALSPLDGRYAAKVGSLRTHFSEFGLFRNRIRVEIEWLKALAAAPEIGEVAVFSPATVAELDAMGANFMSVRRRAATLSAARKHVPNTIAAHLQGQS